MRRFATVTGRLCSDCRSTSETLGFDGGFPAFAAFVLFNGEGELGCTATCFGVSFNRAISSFDVYLLASISLKSDCTG